MIVTQSIIIIDSKKETEEEIEKRTNYNYRRHLNRYRRNNNNWNTFYNHYRNKCRNKSHINVEKIIL